MHVPGSLFDGDMEIMFEICINDHYARDRATKTVHFHCTHAVTVVGKILNLCCCLLSIILYSA